MAYTVAQYALLRKVSESTVKNWIKRLGLDLPQNPGDNRQRLILSEHKRMLDTCGSGSAPTPPVPDFFDVELIPESNYDRSEDTGMLIAEGSIVLARSQYNDSPDSNKVIQALKLITSQCENTNTQALNQIQSDIRSQTDTRASLQAARLIKIKEQAQMRAIQEYRLEQAIVEETKTDLELLELGIHPMGKSAIVVEEEEPLESSSPSSLSPSDLF